MKARLLLLLTILALLMGCAAGYYDTRPKYPEPGFTLNWYQNPETQGEYDMRVWREESGR